MTLDPPTSHRRWNVIGSRWLWQPWPPTLSEVLRNQASTVRSASSSPVAAVTGEARELAEQAKAFDEWNLAEERRVDLLNDVDRPRGKPGASPRDLEPSCTRVRGVDLALDQVLSFQASHHLGSHLDVGTCELGEGFRATEEVCKLRWQESETTTLPTTEERQALMGGVDDEIDLRPVQLVP
jgi:hypothetical protein